MDFTIANGVTSNRTWTFDGGDTGTIEKGGAIETTANVDPGVIVGGNNNTLDNRGSIATMGKSSFGIIANASDSNTFHNSGSISTMGDFTDGIQLSNSKSNALHNSGSIETMGFGAFGYIWQARTQIPSTTAALYRRWVTLPLALV
ncbi:MAG: hypothetical protein ACQ9MH_04225 [Nitrospinales bacterium]